MTGPYSQAGSPGLAAYGSPSGLLFDPTAQQTPYLGDQTPTVRILLGIQKPQVFAQPDVEA